MPNFFDLKRQFFYINFLCYHNAVKCLFHLIDNISEVTYCDFFG